MKKHLLTSSCDGGGGITRLRNNAFTLIELLAIIVILAIIAVITVPIILNIIENSRKGAASDSAYGYKDSVNKTYIAELQNHNKLKLDGTYTVKSDGSLEPAEDNTFGFGDENVTSFPVQVSGTIPSSGKLRYSNNVLNAGCVVIGDYKVTFGTDGKVDGTVKGDCTSYEFPAVSGDSEQSNGGSEPPSNPYLTRFDGTYGYTSPVEVYANSGELVWGDFNDQWEIYFRNNENKTEICGVFGSGQVGTVCLEAGIPNYNTDFEDCSASEVYDGTGNTCIKGYIKAKADEMLAKGATNCYIYGSNLDGSYLDCDMESGGHCVITDGGIARCYDSEGITCYVVPSSNPSCEF